MCLRLRAIKRKHYNQRVAIVSSAITLGLWPRPVRFDSCSALTLLQWIVNWDFIEMLPNTTVVLRIFLTMSISVASCERSFSKLKLVKTYLRSQMSDARLSCLAVLSIERELAEKLDFHDVIKDFATRKARKVHNVNDDVL